MMADDPKQRIAELEEALQNLLAVIHRDGGHYIAEHGIDKATTDAMQLVFDERQDLERGEEALRKAEARRDEYLKFIQTDLNVQIHEAEEVLCETMRVDDWDGIASAIKVIANERDAAEARATDYEQELERHSTDRLNQRARVEVLEEALRKLLDYRTHLQRCEIDQTDFCTCGLMQVANSARQALAQPTAPQEAK
jgi:hypothetical protein